MLRWIFLSGTHLAALVVGFALGVYLLPILTAPEGPDKAMLAKTAQAALFKGKFTRDLKGSDFLHWGEGTISLTPEKIVHEGSLAPGPDYKLYLTKQFVEDEDQFNKIKAQSMIVGDVKTFDGFILDVPDGVDLNEYSTAVVWCEAFGEFITAAKYR
ncbi:MAG: DM13 domain-containing protein [Alphaproteobacteria bacterium]|nr:DM13 domain-containing protein [Alphaproteobacteria bacterium]